MFDDGGPIPEEDSTVPNDKGAAVVAVTVDIMAAAEDDMDTLETFILLGEKALLLILFFTFH